MIKDISGARGRWLLAPLPGSTWERVVPLCNGEETALTTGGSNGRETAQPHGLSGLMEMQHMSLEDS